MKKNGLTLLQIIMIVMILAMATAAFAFRTGGEYASDKYGGTSRYSTALAPTISTVYVLGTKGFFPFDLTNVTNYKFFFSKVSDNTAVTGKVKFGSITSNPTSGFYATTGDSFHAGNNLKTVGFAAYSSATPVQVTIIY